MDQDTPKGICCSELDSGPGMESTLAMAPRSRKAGEGHFGLRNGRILCLSQALGDTLGPR